jgi:molybdopterin-containing oxidoreductase family iron-sulfur binding subunit
MAGEADTLPPIPLESTAREQWRSPEERLDSPEFREMMAREFPDDAETWTDPVTRREFVTLLGASLALAGLNGCSPRPASPRKIVPYTRQPEGLTPGIPLFYATAATLGGVATGIVVKSHEGRPVKVEGNPNHPGCRNPQQPDTGIQSKIAGTDIFSQAAVLGLYDPDRSKSISYLGDSRSWDDVVAHFRAALEDNKESATAGGVRILTETITSPTLAAQIAKLIAKYSKVKWVQYEPAMRDNVREGSMRAFGAYYSTVYDFSQAKVVLALDADFLTQGPGNVRYARDFIAGRRTRVDRRDGVPASAMNRLYAVEPMLTPTGAIADHRLPLKSGEVEAFARALAAYLEVPGVPKSAAAPAAGKDWIKPLAEDLRKNAGASVVVTGEHQSPAVHALVHAINAKLQNTKTVRYIKSIEARPENQLAGFTSLVGEMMGGKVDMLFILGGNPVFSAPADLDFAGALEKVPLRLHMGLYQDETAANCHWQVAEAHFLEAWGDARGHEGTATIQQPLIAPLYRGRSALELIAALAAENDQAEQSALEVVRTYWKANQPADTGDFEHFWQNSLREGVVAKSSFLTAKDGEVKTGEPKIGADTGSPGSIGGKELYFRTDPTIYDGRFANLGWLQELPKPVSKLCWDNAAIMSPKMAKDLKLSAEPRWTAGERGRMEVDYVELTLNGRKVKAAAWIQPGHVDDAVTVYLGYGREQVGKVGTGHGFNAYTLRASNSLWTVGGLDVKKADGDVFIACTQAHHSMEGRKPVRRITGQLLASALRRGEGAEEAKKELDNEMAPPAAAAERKLVFENVPGPRERSGHEKHEGHHENGHKHDARLTDPDGRRGLSMYDETNKEGRRWAMAIDLTSCIGCNSCMIACMAENNIPVVGKKEVTRARELFWIRVDRYHEGDDKDAASLKTYFQPVPCQQCEKAPCEVVCPVGATVHSADGLNDMVYNRCVGTRYCSNNCPYKVRRFNFFTYADWVTESLKLGRNPEVTVRSRGVMEKCTYCVQRIRLAEITAEREWDSPDRPRDAHNRPHIRDGEVVTACQAACPTGAIAFGDLADDDSVVVRWKAEPTNYGLLAELNTMPRTTYLAAVRNPNPEMPKGGA